MELDVLEEPACEQGDFETKWETCSCPNESGSQAFIFLRLCQTTDELVPLKYGVLGTSRRILYLPRILSSEALLGNVGPQDQAARIPHAHWVGKYIS